MLEMDYYYFLRQVYELKKDLWQCYASNITRMFSKNNAFWQYYGSNCGGLMIQITQYVTSEYLAYISLQR